MHVNRAEAAPGWGSCSSMLPWVGCSRPAMTCMSVVLPDPLRPKSSPRQLDGSSRLAPLTMGSGAAAALDTIRGLDHEREPHPSVQARRWQGLTGWLVRQVIDDHQRARASWGLGGRELVQQRLEREAEVCVGRGPPLPAAGCSAAA